MAADDGLAQSVSNPVTALRSRAMLGDGREVGDGQPLTTQRRGRHRRPAARHSAASDAAGPARPAPNAGSCGAGRRRRRCRRRPPRGDAVVSAAGRRRKADQPGVDVGHRPEHRPRHPSRWVTSAYQAAFDARDAVRPAARWRGQPLGDLPLHHHQPVVQATGTRSSRWSSTGTATLYGQVGDQRRGRLRQLVHPQGVRAARTVSRPATAGARGRRRCSGSARGQDRVDLDRQHPPGTRAAARG